MSASAVRIYVCHEPDDDIYAGRLSDWPHTNGGVVYASRAELGVSSLEAETVKATLREQIRAADVIVCVISQGTARSEWVDWELREARGTNPRRGMVGVRLDEHVRVPPGMVDCGAIVVPFRRTTVERAVEWALKENHASGDFTLLDD